MNEARLANHTYVGTEDLMLGLLAEGKGVAAHVLTSFGVTLENARAEMHRLLASEAAAPPSAMQPSTHSRGGDFALVPGPIPASAAGPARVDIVIAEALNMAAHAGASRVEPLHVAISLLAHREGVAIAAMERMGCDVRRLQAELEAMIPPSGSSAPKASIPMGPNLAPLMGAARDEQRAWRAPSVATHHLLLALLDTCPDVARTFSAHGITPERLRDEAKRIVG